MSSSIHVSAMAKQRDRRALRAFAANRLALVGAAILGLVFLIALVGPALTPYDPTTQDLFNLGKAATPEHPLGTDHLGRDLLSRLLYGARYSLLVGVIAVGIGASIGTLVGLLA